MPRSTFLVLSAGTTLTAAVVAACSGGKGSSPASSTPPPAAAAKAPAHDAGHTLHNLIPVTDKLTSGSGPYDDDAFDEIKAMGVKTIISVDGAAPDVERARARGIRYIHLPVGYHGISAERQRELAKAVKESDGPIYLHCHHGKHRGPAAAASAAVLLGDMTPEEGVAFLKKAGTAPTYPGLYRCVQGGSEIDPASLAAMPVTFVEIAPTPAYVQAMAETQDRYDHLVEIRDAGWKAPADHPDLVPLAEAGRLENLMRALVNNPEVTRHPPDFGELMRASAARCREFEDALSAKAPADQLAAKLKAINDSCKACHVKYRDVK
ncbi:MAG: cytochrome c [Phycisphaerales bacterium]